MTPRGPDASLLRERHVSAFCRVPAGAGAQAEGIPLAMITSEPLARRAAMMALPLENPERIGPNSWSLLAVARAFDAPTWDIRPAPLPEPHLTLLQSESAENAAAPVRAWDALEAWRASERDLAGTGGADVDRSEAQARANDARAAYHAVVQERLSRP